MGKEGSKRMILWEKGGWTREKRCAVGQRREKGSKGVVRAGRKGGRE